MTVKNTLLNLCYVSSMLVIFSPLSLQLVAYSQILLEDPQMSEMHFQNYTKYKIKRIKLKSIYILHFKVY